MWPFTKHETAPVTVTDPSPEHLFSYTHCLEEESEDIRESGEHKACWFEKYKARGLRVKLALDSEGVPVGMIQYLPIESSFVRGEGLYFILCIWVHGHKMLPKGDRQGHGIGSRLLEAAETDARVLGAKGMAAWGLWLPFWMKASWFKKKGYTKADRDGMALLLYKPFSDDAIPPQWVRPKKEPPRSEENVTVAAFKNGWCPAQNMVFERTKRACESLGGRVVFLEFDTSDPKVFEEWGISDGVFIDGKPLSWGPPPSYETILKAIKKRL